MFSVRSLTPSRVAPFAVSLCAAVLLCLVSAPSRAAGLPGRLVGDSAGESPAGLSGELPATPFGGWWQSPEHEGAADLTAFRLEGGMFPRLREGSVIYALPGTGSGGVVARINRFRYLKEAAAAKDQMRIVPRGGDDDVFLTVSKPGGNSEETLSARGGNGVRTLTRPQGFGWELSLGEDPEPALVYPDVLRRGIAGQDGKTLFTFDPDKGVLTPLAPKLREVLGASPLELAGYGEMYEGKARFPHIMFWYVSASTTFQISVSPANKLECTSWPGGWPGFMADSSNDRAPGEDRGGEFDEGKLLLSLPVDPAFRVRGGGR